MAFIPTALLKKHLRVSGSSEDVLIQDYYYPAAVAWVADYTGREIVPRQLTYITTLPEMGEALLPAYPVASVDTVEQSQGVMLYQDGSPMLLEDGSPMWLGGSTEGIAFKVVGIDDNGLATIRVSGHDVSELLTVTFTVGYADADLPLQLKQAVLFMVGHFFHNRSEVDSNKMADIPEGAKRLCDPFRVRTFGGA